MLKATSDILKVSFREEDLIARFGGEEFAILLKRENSQEALNDIEAFRMMLEALPMHFAEHTIIQTASIGLCQCKKSIHQSLAQADELVYHSKENGRNQVSSPF